mmetsp:Transcript_20120/g.23307  ORF Transcript_20120/g.23307 Transcript_20120/m.23307 type:complete len:91 (-) Transcript_20120:420-692(-)
MDDTYMVGRLEDVFPLVNKHKEYFEEIGLVLNTGKTKCYIREDFRNDMYHRLRGDDKEGIIELDNNDKCFGLITVQLENHVLLNHFYSKN